MLVGPGGVVALVVGAWGGMWAVRAVPGRPLAVWYPALVAFAGAMAAFALLTAEAEVALQLARWAEAPPADRAGIATEALSLVARPLVGASLGLLLLLSGVAAAAYDRAPVGVHVQAPHAFERVAAVVIAALLLADLWVWISLRRVLRAVTAGEREFVEAAGIVHGRLAMGVGIGLGILSLSAAVGIVRQARRPAPRAGAD